jgi:hypothetical protein
MPCLINRIVVAAVATSLAACVLPLPQRPPALPSVHADVLLATERGMGSIVFDAGHSYLALSNTPHAPSMVLRSGVVVNRASQFVPLDLQACALGPARDGQAPRLPRLRRLNGRIYLFQPTPGSAKEHALCQYERALEWFAPRDDGLRLCQGVQCERLWMTELHSARGQLLSNAGAGPNVLVSADQGASWRAVIGSVERHGCEHGTFQIVGQRLFVAAACPHALAGLRAYQLAGDGVSLASGEPLPLVWPDLQGRAPGVLGQAGASVFAAVAGGLLRSADGGASFAFVIGHPRSGPHTPQVNTLLALRNREHVLLAAGTDLASGHAYLALSVDGGQRWTDVSASLPDHQRRASVTSLTQDPLGRILLTLTLQAPVQGRLVLLTLGRLD